jgi:23S rRNA pseudouridine2605 synthase
MGQSVTDSDEVTLDGHAITPDVKTLTLILNKPVGYVVSRGGQGNRTIYDLLPAEYHNLKPVGRLDKDSSGLLLVTNDGQLAQELTHPKYQKEKIYEILLDRQLNEQDRQRISGVGASLDDGPSRLALSPGSGDGRKWRVEMNEGRNRQIRRTFAALGYRVIKLHRVKFGKFELNSLNEGKYIIINNL